MYVLPLMTGMMEHLSGKPCPHGTLLGLIPPTAVSCWFCWMIICYLIFLSVGICHSQGLWYEVAVERKSHTF